MLCQAVTDDTDSRLAEIQDWKEPTQARSRARVSAILDAARDLSIEAGRLDFKMSDVAKRASVPIGSVYQYFPTRTALLARLFAREMEPIDASLREGLKRARSVDDVIAGIGRLIRSHVKLVRARPGLFVIWTSPSMDSVLQKADLENSRQNARAIVETVLSMKKGAVDETALWGAALLICHLWGAVIRLCVMTREEDPEQSVLDQYIQMIELHLGRLLG